MVKISDITKVGIEKAKIHTNVAEKKASQTVEHGND